MRRYIFDFGISVLQWSFFLVMLMRSFFLSFLTKERCERIRKKTSLNAILFRVEYPNPVASWERH